MAACSCRAQSQADRHGQGLGPLLLLWVPHPNPNKPAHPGTRRPQQQCTLITGLCNTPRVNETSHFINIKETQKSSNPIPHLFLERWISSWCLNTSWDRKVSTREGARRQCNTAWPLELGTTGSESKPCHSLTM